MEESYVHKDTFELAKKKGYMPDLKFVSVYRGQMPMELEPTQALLQKWIREVHKMDVAPWCDGSLKKHPWLVEVISIPDGEDLWVTIKGCAKYEEALEIGLYQALTLIDKKWDQ